jgi:hypothetical protein
MGVGRRARRLSENPKEILDKLYQGQETLEVYALPISCKGLLNGYFVKCLLQYMIIISCCNFQTN